MKVVLDELVLYQTKVFFTFFDFPYFQRPNKTSNTTDSVDFVIMEIRSPSCRLGQSRTWHKQNWPN